MDCARAPDSSVVKTAPEVLTTARMRGERLGPDHQAVMEPMFADPRVGATMGGVWTPEQVAEHLAIAAAEWERDGFGYWMFFDSASGEPVGRGGLGRTEFDAQPEVEVGWTVTPERWGEGIATELGAATLEVASDLGLRDIVAFTLPHNAASRRIMEKLGFTYEKTAPYKTFGDHVLYRWAGTSRRA
jgi:RimJ/RimL family protein N-acetyltransferase